MKNILTGILLVVLAAVVVNKKMWKYRTFLMLVAGILIAMMAVNILYPGKEMFQIPNPCTDNEVYAGSGKFYFNETMAGNPLTASIQTAFTQTITTSILDSTLSNTGIDGIILFVRARIINAFLANSCWDRVRQFLIWHMARDSLIFTYMQKANTYTGNLDENTETRYMNFLAMLNENAYLCGSDYSIPANMGTVSERGTSQQNLFRALSLLQMIFAFYGLRANTPITDANDEKLNVLGVWLGKAAQWNAWPHGGVGRLPILRRISVLPTRYLNYSSSGFITSANIDWHVNDLIYNLFLTTFMNTTHGIRGGVPEADTISATIQDFYTMMFACFMIKLFALDMNVPLVSGKDTITQAVSRQTETLSNTQTMQDFFNNQLKELMQKILKNVACHEYIAAAAAAKGLTGPELDILLRNYFAGDKCLKPIETDAIVAIINSVNKATNAPFSVTQLNTNYVPQLYAAADAKKSASQLHQIIGLNVRRIMFKSKLNDTDPNLTSTTYETLALGSANTGHIRMFNYIFNNAINEVVPTYFNSDFIFPNTYFITSTPVAYQQYRYLEISPETLVGYINTNKQNFSVYNSKIGLLKKTA